MGLELISTAEDALGLMPAYRRGHSCGTRVTKANSGVDYTFSHYLDVTDAYTVGVVIVSVSVSVDAASAVGRQEQRAIQAGVSEHKGLDRHAAAIRRLARADEIRAGDVAPKGSAQIIIGEATVCLPLGNLVDLAAEKARLEKAIGKVDAEMERIDKKLSNEKFVANADPEVVATERERKAELEVQLTGLKTAMQRVNEAG